MLDIRPITDLRNTAAISEACHANSEPIFLTKNGYSDLVIMSAETYEAIIEDARIDRAITEFRAHNKGFVSAREILPQLRRKHFGDL